MKKELAPFKPNKYNMKQERLPEMNLETLKEQRRMYTNIFTLLYRSKFTGDQIPACADALKFVDSMVQQIQADVEKLEPKPVKAEVVADGSGTTEQQPTAVVQPA